MTSSKEKRMKQIFIHQEYWSKYASGGRTGFSMWIWWSGVGREVKSLHPYQIGQICVTVRTCKRQSCTTAQRWWSAESGNLCRSHSFPLKRTVFFYTSSRVLDTQIPIFGFKVRKAPWLRGPGKGQGIQRVTEGDNCGFPLLFVGTYTNFSVN